VAVAVAYWVAVWHPEGDEARGLTRWEAVDAGCAGEYLRAWLSVHMPAIREADVFVNGIRFDLYPGPPVPRVPYIPQTVQRERRKRRGAMIDKIRAWNAAHRPPK
jgi:hypothetical protein